MFSFARKNKIGITSVSIPRLNVGWKKIKDDQSEILWINTEQTTAISLHFFEKPPDIPSITSIEALRNFYRHSVSRANGGLIEVELCKKNKISFVRSIFKFRQEKSGMAYIASLTIPFKSCSFVVKVQAIEAGITGMRDAVIADRLIAEGTISIGETGFLNWFSDPYNDDFAGGVLMNKSEQDLYDEEFPDHPLSRARQLLEQIEQGLQWKPELESIPAFEQ